MAKTMIGKLLSLPEEARESALAELTALSGILKLDELLQERLKEFPMLDYDLREHLDRWARRVLRSTTLGDTLA
jgi:hypothetical protein